MGAKNVWIMQYSDFLYLTHEGNTPTLSPHHLHWRQMLFHEGDGERLPLHAGKALLWPKSMVWTQLRYHEHAGEHISIVPEYQQGP